MQVSALGMVARARLKWEEGARTAPLRVCLLNVDESGSMSKQMRQNLELYRFLHRTRAAHFDAVIIHGFGYDSHYEIFATPEALSLFEGVEHPNLTTHEIEGLWNLHGQVKHHLEQRTADGTTCPRTHHHFLRAFSDALERIGTQIELVVGNSSDGGFDRSAPQAEIREEMLRLTSSCRCTLIANLLVGAKGSPEALHFFTGDAELFHASILLSTVPQDHEGILEITKWMRARDADFTAQFGIDWESDALTWYSFSPPIAYHAITALEDGEGQGDALLVYSPEVDGVPSELIVQRHVPDGAEDGSERVSRARVVLDPEPVKIDAQAQEVFELVAETYSDNPYIREEERARLNVVLAELERLSRTRQHVLMQLTSSEDEMAEVNRLETLLEENSAAYRFLEDADEASTPRERAARAQLLNQARHRIKALLREATANQQQRALEREEQYLRQHPHHWVVWLAPVLELLYERLGKTQRDEGDAVAHLSTRIRSAKSREDNQKRAVDRYVDRMLARSRERQDWRARRRALAPHEDAPIEEPAPWLDPKRVRCPVTKTPVTQGIFGLPFVADRSDLTSGNVTAGGQNVDRIPVPREKFHSIEAVEHLMWAPTSGQMAAPYATERGLYNAVIPILLGAAKPSTIDALKRSIGWLCTGTSAFEPAMAEVIPAALGSVLGRPSWVEQRDIEGVPSRDEQAHALLRTTALFYSFWSYPYVANTTEFNESRKKIPLPLVWAESVMDMSGTASLQACGSTSSLLARAVGASELDAEQVARDLFQWCARNLARSILGAQDVPCGVGKEGLTRLAALTRARVELDHNLGEAPRFTPKSAHYEALPESRAKRAHQLEWSDTDTERVIGPYLGTIWRGQYLDGERITKEIRTYYDHFANILRTESASLEEVFWQEFNAWLTTDISDDDFDTALYEVSGLLGRLAMEQHRHRDRKEETYNYWRKHGEREVGKKVVLPTDYQLGAEFHHALRDHFGLLSLESVSPTRFSAKPPRIAHRFIEMQRIKKAGEIRWVPPQDAIFAEGDYNKSAIDYIDAHPAFYPLRALLRLRRAKLLGQTALGELRKTSTRVTPIPDCNNLISEMASFCGGMDEVMLMFYRAFAFVLDNAGGYADRHWVSSSWRDASIEEVEELLGLPSFDGEHKPSVQAYGKRKFKFPQRPISWPVVDSRGCLPKSRMIDGKGNIVGALVRCTSAQSKLDDEALCRAGVGYILNRCRDEIPGFIDGLHREARGLLGDYPDALQDLTGQQRYEAYRDNLVPVLAGRVRGDITHPEFFEKCVIVLDQLAELPRDTRELRAEENERFIANEARALRKQR